MHLSISEYDFPYTGQTKYLSREEASQSTEAAKILRRTGEKPWLIEHSEDESGKLYYFLVDMTVHLVKEPTPEPSHACDVTGTEAEKVSRKRVGKPVFHSLGNAGLDAWIDADCPTGHAAPEWPMPATLASMQFADGKARLADLKLLHVLMAYRTERPADLPTMTLRIAHLAKAAKIPRDRVVATLDAMVGRRVVANHMRYKSAHNDLELTLLDRVTRGPRGWVTVVLSEALLAELHPETNNLYVHVSLSHVRECASLYGLCLLPAVIHARTLCKPTVRGWTMYPMAFSLTQLARSLNSVANLGDGAYLSRVVGNDKRPGHLRIALQALHAIGLTDGRENITIERNRISFDIQIVEERNLLYTQLRGNKDDFDPKARAQRLFVPAIEFLRFANEIKARTDAQGGLQMRLSWMLYLRDHNLDWPDFEGFKRACICLDDERRIKRVPYIMTKAVTEIERKEALIHWRQINRSGDATSGEWDVMQQEQEIEAWADDLAHNRARRRLVEKLHAAIDMGNTRLIAAE